MEENFEKREILKVIELNKGISVEDIIEYLDYINKVRYSQREVNLFLEDLIREQKVIFKNNLWYRMTH